MHTLLHVVGSCWAKFETSQTFEPATPNISSVPWSPKRSATMLDPFAQLLLSSSNIVGSTHAHYTWSAKSYRLIETFLHCTADPNIVKSCCTRLETTANTDATTPNIIGPTLFDFLISLRLHDYDGHCPKAAYVLYRTSPKECKFHSFCNWIQSLEIQLQKNFPTLYKWHRNDTVIK